jgi:hypothetical protein
VGGQPTAAERLLIDVSAVLVQRLRCALDRHATGEGEFERLLAEKPLVRLHYPGGLSPADLLALPLVLRQLQEEHPNSALRIRSMQEGPDGVAVTITLDDLAGRSAEAVAPERAVLQAKLQCIEAERDRLATSVVPRLLDLVAMSRQMIVVGEITGRAAIGGPMSGDTFNTTAGQIGAVGPDAHVHDNTFQQIQGGLDLPRLAEELARLRTVMEDQAAGKPEQDKALDAIVAAEKAAIQGDGLAVLKHLKRAGRWALDVAEKIGVAVAVEALKRAM